MYRSLVITSWLYVIASLYGAVKLWPTIDATIIGKVFTLAMLFGSLYICIGMIVFAGVYVCEIVEAAYRAIQRERLLMDQERRRGC